MEQSDIKELIKQSRSGNTQAFASLVARFQSLVFRLAFRLLCDEEEAKDIVQEVFVKVWMSLDKYNPEFKFSTWIYKITGNACYDRLRVAQYRNRASETGIDFAAFNILSCDNADSCLINEELRDLITYFTSGLTPKQKLVFTLRDLEELEPGEIETITGLSPAKIKSNLYLARKHIREKMNKTDYKP